MYPPDVANTVASFAQACHTARIAQEDLVMLQSHANAAETTRDELAYEVIREFGRKNVSVMSNDVSGCLLTF